MLGDAVREVIDDTAEEKRPTRADVLRGRIKLREAAFETIEQIRDWQTRGKQLAQQCLKSDQFTLWLAGNHLGVLPVLEQLGSDSLVLQFDAHLDIHDFHDTTKELSHGNFLRYAERLPPIVNVGHRDLLIPEAEVAGTFAATYSAEQVATDGERILGELSKRAAAAKQIWIDIDCDAIDPAYLPGVQHPLPFGLSPPLLLRFVQTVWSEKLIGVSISEFDPGRDIRESSLNLLGWLIEWMLIKTLTDAPG